MTLRITWQVATGQFERAMAERHRPIARAGFPRRWQNAFRVDRYPKSGVSINAAAFAFHRIPYAGVFETGATITGQPRLWCCRCRTSRSASPAGA